MIRTQRGIEVRPLSRLRIRELAAEIRRHWGGASAKFPIAEFVDRTLSALYPQFVFHIVTKKELGGRHGLTLPDQGIVLIREDVYEGAVDGQGRDRFTIAHEFGHLMMHRGTAFGREGFHAPHPFYVDSEWQANTFAGELLVSVEFAESYLNPGKIVSECAVSFDAASAMYQQFEKEGLLIKKRKW